MLSVVEPYASPISERMAALKKAHKLGLRTYGMLCPLLPGIADAPEQIDQLVRFAKGVDAEEVFCEPVNSRGNSLTLTEKVLLERGYSAEAAAVRDIGKDARWSAYTVRLVRNVQKSMRQHMTVTKLRFLLYPSRLAEHDKAKIQKASAGVIWL